jgi:ATP-dependent Lhr-like helicase
MTFLVDANLSPVVAAALGDGGQDAILQRLGRSGRRAETRRSALLLATDDDALLRVCAVLLRWAEGYVEPILPPPAPYHLVAQQALALSLQEAGVGRRVWKEWLGEPFVLGEKAASQADVITDHLVATGFLAEDGGIVGVGETAEASLGRRTSWSCCRCSRRRRCSASATAATRSAWSPTRP